MNENRTFPRFLPRPGATVSITVGQSLTPLIEPMVKSWRAGLPRADKPPPPKFAFDAPTPPVLTAETRAESDTEAVRTHQDHHADYLGGAFDPDEATRREITSLLQEKLRALGEKVEEGEGRFANGSWSHSRRKERVLSPQVPLPSGE